MGVEHVHPRRVMCTALPQMLGQTRPGPGAPLVAKLSHTPCAGAEAHRIAGSGNQSHCRLCQIQVDPLISLGQLAVWQQHTNYSTGMRVAELATQWITRGQSPSFWPKFLMWARKVCGPAIGGAPLFGELNHSRHFIYELTQSSADGASFRPNMSAS